MNYDDAYKAMLLNRGGNVNNSDIKNSKDSINRKFKNDPSYKLAKLKKRDITIDEIDLDTRIVNIDTDTKKKKLYLRPDTNVEVGDYIKYPNKTYLVLAIEENLISPYASSEECNYIIKWIFNNKLYQKPCIVTNQTKYTLGVTTPNGAIITEGDSRYEITMPYNDETKNIKTGQRFIFNGNAWKVTQTDYVSAKGLLSILLGQTAINYEVDDLDNEIANAKTVKHIYTYNIPDSVEITKNGDINLVYSIKDETSKDIDYNLVSVSTNYNNLIQLTNTNGLINIKGLDAGLGTIKLVAELNSETKEFTINFEVKDTVVNQVNYTTDFSQTTTIKQYVTSILQAVKYINGIQDNTLKISYSFDSVGQSLISSNKIVITRKSDSSIGIKNASVTTKTTVYLTVTDDGTGTKILDNQAIVLINGL